MPEYDPWGLSGPIRNIGGILAQTPRLRAEAAAALQRAKLTGAQIDTEGAQAEHYRAATRKIDTETAGLNDLKSGDERRGMAMRRLSVNPNDTEALSTVLEESGKAMRLNPEREIQGISRLLGMFRSMGATNLQGADPVGLATAANGPVSAGSGVDRQTWEQVTTPAEVQAQRPTIVQPGAAALPPGYMAGRTEPFNQPSAAIRAQQPMVTEEFPAQEATEAVPGTPPGTSGMLWWKKQTPGTPGTPGQPAMPKRTLRRPPTAEELQGIGNRMQSQTNAPNQLDADTARAILTEAKGDKNLARKIAAERGYTF